MARLAVSFGLVAAFSGCDQLGPEVDGEDALALSARGNKDDPDCERVHDPRTDRDHRFHKRCERYSQKNRRRSGKAGNAVLTTRALMDAQRVTELEATTGTFDDMSVAPGKIDELRVEIAKTHRRLHDNRSLVAKNTKDGYVRVTLPPVVHGQSMTISARINGIDRGEDRVSVDETVQYRPDLAIGAISVPATTSVGMPTSLSASVREMMGDQGAKADCLLSVDGSLVDRVNGIWVDSGSMVTCHFTYTFATAGAHRVAVDVANVAPRDYDMTNNHAEIDVSAAAQFAFSGSVSDFAYTGQDVEDVVDASGAILYHREDGWAGTNQSLSVSGTWPSAAVFPLKSVSVTATSGLSTWPLISLAGVDADPSDGSGASCASRNDDTGYNWVGVCAMNLDGAPTTQISVSAFAGEVTYHSLGVCQTTSSYYDCAGGYTWNSGSDQLPGVRRALTGEVTFGLKVTDASGTSLNASPVIPLAPYASNDDSPRTCEDQPEGVQHCFSHKYGETGLSGVAGGP
jgi:hypothetical protein